MKNKGSTRKQGEGMIQARMAQYLKEARIVKTLNADELNDLADGVVPERLKLVLKPHDFLRDFAAEMSDGGSELRLIADKILRRRVSLAIWQTGGRELPPATKFLVEIAMRSE